MYWAKETRGVWGGYFAVNSVKSSTITPRTKQNIYIQNTELCGGRHNRTYTETEQRVIRYESGETVECERKKTTTKNSNTQFMNMKNWIGSPDNIIWFIFGQNEHMPNDYYCVAVDIPLFTSFDVVSLSLVVNILIVAHLNHFPRRHTHKLLPLQWRLKRKKY